MRRGARPARAARRGGSRRRPRPRGTRRAASGDPNGCSPSDSARRSTVRRRRRPRTTIPEGAPRPSSRSETTAAGGASRRDVGALGEQLAEHVEGAGPRQVHHQRAGPRDRGAVASVGIAMAASGVAITTRSASRPASPTPARVAQPRRRAAATRRRRIGARARRPPPRSSRACDQRQRQASCRRARDPPGRAPPAIPGRRGPRRSALLVHQ